MRWINHLGAPGRYVLVAVVLTALWFPFRLWLDHGDPILTILVRSGLYGATWALFPWLVEVLPSPRGRPEKRPVDRRLSITLGLGAGVPFFGALLALCVVTGRWVSAGGYVVVLAGIAAAAAWSYRKERADRLEAAGAAK